MFKIHKSLYFIFAIIAVLALGGLVLFKIYDFRMDEEILSALPWQKSPHSTKDWTYYKNEEYKFEIKYPKELAGAEGCSTADYSFCVEEPRVENPDIFEHGCFLNEMDISVYKDVEAKNLEEWFKAEYPNTTAGEVIKAKTIFKGYEALKIWDDRDQMCYPGVLTVFFKDSDLFEIRTFSPRGERVLLTLKFFDSDNITDMVNESKISGCSVNSDCVIVPYKVCCGAQQKAINKQYVDEYNNHPEWQGQADPNVCSQMGCPSRMPASKAACVNKVCQLDYQ